MELQLQTVSAVSKKFGISTRMLRYYEQIGLIESQRKEDYSYRVYNEIAVNRLRQIILLRKLRISMKQIKDILDKQEIAETNIKAGEEIQIHPVEVQFGVGLLPLLTGAQETNFTDRIKHLKQKIANDMGVVIDYMAFMDNLKINSNGYVIKIKGKEVAAGEIMPSHYLIMEPGVKAEYKDIFANIEGVKTKDPAYGIPAKWISFSDVEKAQTLGYTVIDPISVVITHLNEIIKTHAKEF